MTTGYVRTLVCVGLGALVGFALFATRPVAHALPEYATRTGEPCATCHVNPAGGGPRTQRSNLWVAAGRPDKVPEVPGGGGPGNNAEPAAKGPLEAGDASAPALYAKLGCAGCHGAAGEGGPGPALNRGEASAARLSQVIRNGQGAMTGYRPEAMPDADLARLVTYVQSIGRGETKSQAQVPSPTAGPARLGCSQNVDHELQAAGAPAGSCGGN